MNPFTLDYNGEQIAIPTQYTDAIRQQYQAGQINSEQDAANALRTAITGVGLRAGEKIYDPSIGVYDAPNSIGKSASKFYAYLQGVEAPTEYVAGSLQPGQTPQVVAGTAQPEIAPTNSSSGGSTQQSQGQVQTNTATQQPQSQADILLAQAKQMLATTPGQPAGQPTTQSIQSYTVQSGDSLSKIAQRYGVPVSAISGFKSGNPNLIYPGESLTISKQVTPTVPSPTQGGTPQFSMEQIRQQASLTPQQNLAIEAAKVPPPVKQSLQNNGITADDDTLSSMASASPVKFVTDLYAELYKNQGLGTIKTQYEQYVKDTNDVTNEMNSKIVDINDNPWLSEAERSRKVSSLKEKYQGKLDALTNQTKLLDSFYQNGLNEVRFLTQQASTAYNKQIDFQNDVYLKALDHAYNIAEAQEKKSQPISVGEGNSLYDPVTGKVIFTAPKTFSPGSGSNLDSLLSIAEAQTLGVPFGTTKSQVVGVTPEKQATESQNTAAGYAVRIAQAIPTIDSLEASIVKRNPITFYADINAPSSLQSAEARQYMQSARNFINAQLRRESGAVISPSEFSEAKAQYLPYPGDDARTLALKRQNRATALASLQNASGSAYQKVSNLSSGANIDPKINSFLQSLGY